MISVVLILFYFEKLKIVVISAFQTGSTVAASALASATGMLGSAQPSEAASSKMWKPVKVPFAETLYDLDFDT